MSSGKLIERLPAKPLDRLLIALQEVRRRQSAGEEVALPLMTLHLRSGKELRGWMLDLGRDEDQGALLIRLESSDTRPSDDVAYVALSSILGITVHAAERSADLISFGTIEGPVGPAPTKLELKRKFQALSQTLNDRFKLSIAFDAEWDGVPEKEEALRRLQSALTDVTVTLTGTAESDLGADALKALKKIVLSMSSPTGKAGETLTVHVAPMGAPATSRDQLRTEIEAQL